MKKESRKGVRYGLVIAIVFSVLFVVALNPQIIVQNDEEGYATVKFDFPVSLAAEADPGAGNGGILSVYFINYTAAQTPPTTNDSSDLETWAANVGYVSYNNTSPFQQQLKHTTTFAVVVRVRGNAEQCKRGTDFYDTDLNVTWRCDDFTVADGTSMTGYVSYNNSGDEYLYMNFVDDNGGAGYSLNKDQSVTIQNIKFDAYS